MADLEQRLRHVVDPYDEHPDDDTDMLLWRAGEMYRQIESAHHWLDMKGAPSKESNGTLTLRGRMDKIEREETKGS